MLIEFRAYIYIHYTGLKIVTRVKEISTYNVQCALCNDVNDYLQSTLHNAVYYIQNTVHYTMQYIMYIQYTVHYTMQYFIYSLLYITQCSILYTVYCTLHNAVYYIQYTVQCT